MFHPSQIDKFLTVSEIDTIRRSYLILSVESAYADELFYEHLFSNRPEMRELFDGDISAQSERLTITNMLGMIVSQIHNLPELMPMLGDLARRHTEYGVTAEHYADAGRALQSMLQDILGSKFDAEVEAAWAKAYDGIAVTMVNICFGSAGVLKYRETSEI